MVSRDTLEVHRNKPIGTEYSITQACDLGMKEKSIKQYFIGESAICWSFEEAISPAGSARVLRIHRALKNLQRETKLDVLDVVPSYNSVAVYFNPVSSDIQQIQDHVQVVIDEDERITAAKGSTTEILGKRAVLPVQYDGADLERVAAHNGLSQKDVISLHINATYSVATIGFLPHFPYLIGLNQKLITPRRDKPRTHVPAGSVAIGGSQTGVYPCVSPGGWNILGTTDPALLVFLEPGDRIVFREI